MKANIEIDLPEDFEDKVEYLKNTLGLENKAEVLYYAVNILYKINEAQKKGNKVVIPPSHKSAYISGATTTIKAE